VRRGNVGLGFTGFGAGVWDNKANSVVKDIGSRDKGKGCPWIRERVRENHHGKDTRQIPLGDLECGWGWDQ